MGANLTAEAFIAALEAHRSEAERAKISRSFRGSGEIIGVRMKHTFDTAKAFDGMPLEEVESLLDSPHYEARMGAVSIMDFKARRKRTGEEERKALFELSTALMLKEADTEHARKGAGVYTVNELRPVAGAIFAVRLISDVTAIGLSDQEGVDGIPICRSLGVLTAFQPAAV